MVRLGFRIGYDEMNYNSAYGRSIWFADPIVMVAMLCYYRVCDGLCCIEDGLTPLPLPLLLLLAKAFDATLCDDDDEDDEED